MHPLVRLLLVALSSSTFLAIAHGDGCGDYTTAQECQGFVPINTNCTNVDPLDCLASYIGAIPDISVWPDNNTPIACLRGRANGILCAGWAPGHPSSGNYIVGTDIKNYTQTLQSMHCLTCGWVGSTPDSTAPGWHGFVVDWYDQQDQPTDCEGVCWSNQLQEQSHTSALMPASSIIAPVVSATSTGYTSLTSSAASTRPTASSIASVSTGFIGASTLQTPAATVTTASAGSTGSGVPTKNAALRGTPEYARVLRIALVGGICMGVLGL